MSVLSEPPVHAGEPAVQSCADVVSADVLQGLETLVELCSEAEQTLNRAVRSVESALNAHPVAGEVWVPIPDAQAPGEGRPEEPAPAISERVFNGVTMKIMTMAASPELQAGTACGYEVGCARLEDRWALVIRTGTNRTELLCAPFPVRLRAVRLIGRVLALIQNQ